MTNLFRTPVLTRQRVGLAFTVALVCDGLQLLFGPAGWVVVDQVIDLTAMLLVSVILGFHPLFLPTFVAEFIPGVDMVPTWTGCIALVVALRRRQQQPNSPPGQSTDVIDV